MMLLSKIEWLFVVIALLLGISVGIFIGIAVSSSTDTIISICSSENPHECK